MTLYIVPPQTVKMCCVVMLYIVNTIAISVKVQYAMIIASTMQLEHLRLLSSN